MRSEARKPPRCAVASASDWDGPWLALWPLSMAVGVWGTGMLYRALMEGTPTLWPGLVLSVGGLWLSGRWVSQARRLRRAWRQGGGPATPSTSDRAEPRTGRRAAAPRGGTTAGDIRSR